MNYQEIAGRAKCVCVCWQQRKRNEHGSRVWIRRKLMKSLQDNTSMRKWSLTYVVGWETRVQDSISALCFKKDHFGRLQLLWKLWRNVTHLIGGARSIGGQWICRLTVRVLMRLMCSDGRSQGRKRGGATPGGGVLSAADIRQDFPGISGWRACGAGRGAENPRVLIYDIRLFMLHIHLSSLKTSAAQGFSTLCGSYLFFFLYKRPLDIFYSSLCELYRGTTLR